MLTEDYIIRMINLAVAALLRILGLKKAGDYDDALELIDITLEQLIGLRSHLVKHMDDERFYFLLTRNEQLDTRRLALIAELFKEEGDIYAAQNRVEESLDDYNRTLRYSLEIFFNLSPEERAEITPQIDTLLQIVPTQALRTDALWPLAGYYEETGAFQKSEALLLALADNSTVREAVIPELAAFYQRLLDLPLGQLTASNIDPAQVKEKLKRWKKLAP